MKKNMFKFLIGAALVLGIFVMLSGTEELEDYEDFDCGC